MENERQHLVEKLILRSISYISKQESARLTFYSHKTRSYFKSREKIQLSKALKFGCTKKYASDVIRVIFC